MTKSTLDFDTVPKIVVAADPDACYVRADYVGRTAAVVRLPHVNPDVLWDSAGLTSLGPQRRAPFASAETPKGRSASPFAIRE